MPRRVEITVPSDRTKELVGQLQHFKGVVGLRVQRDISLQPPGDVLTVEVTNRSLHHLLQLLNEQAIGQEPDSAIALTTNRPFSLISPSSTKQIEQDNNEATWEEMEALIRNNTSMNANVLLLMTIAGALAAVGLATNTIHIVIGAIVIAPGFEPIAQVALGVVAESPAAWRSGLMNTTKGYAALIAGAAVTGMVLQALGIPPLGGKASYLAAGSLVSYWTNITAVSILVSALAGVSGAILIVVHRAVLTAGAMLALALIPSAALISLGFVAGSLNVAGKGLLRWAIEVGLVVVTSLLVFVWKRTQVQKRRMMF